MSAFRFLLFTALFFTFYQVHAQSLNFNGIIRDAHTKEPISYASVYFKRSGVGKTSDSAGNFSFYMSRFTPDTLVVTYVGYEQYHIPVNDSVNGKTMVIELQRGSATGGVVVKSKINKGLFLWRKIMSRKKQYNRTNLANFGYEAYNKLEVDIKNFKADKAKKSFLLKPFAFVFDNIDSTSEKEPFLPAYLVESVSDYAYQKNTKKYFENIKASNTKGFSNESISKLMGVMNQNVNVYANYVNVMDKDFISPFNDNADVYYNFAVPDTQMVGGRKIFHFVFSPKHPGQNTFEGDAWVFGQTYQIQKVNLYLGKDANINYIDRISVFQEFIPVNDTLYFLKRDKFFADFKVLGKQSLTFIGRKTTSYRNIIINSDSITNLFKTQNIEEVVKTAPGSNQQTDSAWKALRHDSLSTNEKAIYATVDKLLAMPKFQRLQNTLKFIGTGYKQLTNYEIGPWFNWISANGWEGTRVRFDLGTTTGFNKHIYLHTYLAYGFKDKQFKGKAEAYWIVKRDPLRFRLHASYYNDIDNGISQLGDVGQDNIFSLAIRKPGINRKYLRLQDMRFEVFKELGKGFSTELFLSNRQYTPLKNLPFKETFPVSEGLPLSSFDVAVKLRFAYLEQFIEGDYFRYSLGTKYPVAELMFTKGFSGILNSAYNYTRISASVKDFMKISPYGSFSYKVYAGKVNGVVPFTILENHPGNDIYYYSPGSFNLMSRFEYLSDKYAGINVEHNVGSGLFRFTALTRKMKLRQFWNAKAVWGSLSPENVALNNKTGSFKTLNGSTYLEMGTGIDNILKVFRLDFVWRVLPRPLPVEKSSRFGIFGSFQFQF
ncbi:MAG: carboxypeptidase-like regulatory domain-containing protein [Bacteroidetes bacterium]|nr:carboxypeptidase-like regulatory domain-containing protein [Bacteroidota bacterium]